MPTATAPLPSLVPYSTIILDYRYLHLHSRWSVSEMPACGQAVRCICAVLCLQPPGALLAWRRGPACVCACTRGTLVCWCWCRRIFTYIHTYLHAYSRRSIPTDPLRQRARSRPELFVLAQMLCRAINQSKSSKSHTRAEEKPHPSTTTTWAATPASRSDAVLCPLPLAP